MTSLAQFVFDQNLVPRLEVSLWVVSLMAIVGALGYWIWRKIKAKKGQLRELSPGTLRRIWNAFLRQIPPEFRRHVLFFQPFVVFGEAASGKSLLISKYTDWKGQAAQFYSSYSVDPQLQIYLGSRALVQEVPATLLADTSQKARTALINLWQPIFKKRDPIVVVALSAAAIKSATAEALRTQAQMLRGKINVLSRIVNKPVTVRIVLTHMDQVEGYVAFSDFVEKNGIPYQLQIDPKSPAAGLATCLEPIEAYLSTALVTLPAKSYLKVLTFLNKAPETFKHLGVFVNTLVEPDPLSFDPEVKDLYLTSDTSGSPSAISNPFATSWINQSIAIERAILERHKRITYVLGAALLGYLGTGFFVERSRIAAAEVEVAAYEDARVPAYAAAAAEKIKAFTEGTDSRIAHVVLPRFFRNASEQLRERFVSATRKHYLKPLEKEVPTRPNAHERALYLLGLVYAANGDELGRYVTSKSAEWARALDVPEPIITTYVELSDRPFSAPVDFGRMPYERRVHRFAQVEPWHSFFIELRQHIERRSLSADDLAKLQRDATELKQGFESMLERSTAKEVHDRLRLNPHFDRKVFVEFLNDLAVPQWLLTNQEAITTLLDRVRSSEMDVAKFEKGNLYELVYRLKGIQARALDQTSIIKIELEKTYSFDVREWSEVVSNGKIRLVVQEFIRANEASGTQIFFANAGSFGDVAMRPPTSSDYLFPGRGRVEGPYTRAAYDRVVKPQLEQFETLVDPLALDQDVKGQLIALVDRAIEQYTNDYETQWHGFYEAWRVNADSLQSLKIILGQMKLPTSRFQEFLDRVRENTSYDQTSSRYQRPMFDKLAGFRPINQISAITTGSLTELEKYRRILARIQSDLDNGADAPPPEEGPKKQEIIKGNADYEDVLTPVGRLSYAILTERRDSYLLEAEKWLKAAGINEEWRRPFLEPIQQLFRIGLADMQEAAHRGWNKRVLGELVPLLEKFPFNQAAIADATPRDVEVILYPTSGSYWKAFRQYVQPLLIEEGGRWRQVAGLDGTGFRWPDGMFEMANAVSALTGALWDMTEKNPKPLVFEVQPEALPRGKPGKPQVILSFLKVGTSTVFGFNQKSSWQTLKVSWWTRPAAEVGLAVGDPENQRDKSHRQLHEPDSAWSFYRLLLKDRQSEQNVYVWNLTQGEPEFPSPLLKFTFKDDPWAVFKLPNVPKKQEKAGP